MTTLYVGNLPFSATEAEIRSLFEQHGNTWTYVMDEHCPKGPHELMLRAEDENGNKTELRFRFTR